MLVRYDLLAQRAHGLGDLPHPRSRRSAADVDAEKCRAAGRGFAFGFGESPGDAPEGARVNKRRARAVEGLVVGEELA